MLTGHAHVLILRHEAVRVLIELLECLAAPPGLQVSIPIVFPPVVIEGVRQLVTNGEPDSSVVKDVRTISIVKWILEDSERNDDLVHDCSVVSIDGSWCGAPRLFRHGFPQLGNQLLRSIF